MLNDPLDEAQAENQEVDLRTCVFSGDQFPVSQMIKYGDDWVATIHKDAFVQSLAETTQPEGSAESLQKEYKNIVIWWEKWRIAFNGLVGFTGLVFSFGLIADMTLPIYLFLGVLYGVAANICYFAGPFVELYLHALFPKLPFHSGIRIALFAIGTGFSILVTMGLAIACNLVSPMYW